MGTFIGRIHSLERLLNTPDGNPRYRLHLDGGAVVDTMPDADVTVTNYGPGSSHEGRPLRLTTNERGQLTHAELAPEEDAPGVDELREAIGGDPWRPDNH